MATTVRRSGSGSDATQMQWADRLGTIGWAAKGVVYLLLAVIVGQLALSGDTSGEEASKQGALQRLAEQPFGGAMLTAVAVGLAAYAAYRLLTVFLPTTGDDDKDKAKHVLRVGSAIVYGALALQAWSVRSGGGGQASGGQSGGQGGSQTEQTWSAALMDSGLGQVVLLLAGVGLLVAAGYQVHRGVSKKFMDHIECRDRWPSQEGIERAGTAGHIARGAVLALLGIFVVIAVWQHDPNEVRGLDDSLRRLAEAPAGPLALLAVGAGLACYGVYSIMAARCRRHTDG